MANLNTYIRWHAIRTPDRVAVTYEEERVRSAGQGLFKPGNIRGEPAGNLHQPCYEEFYHCPRGGLSAVAVMQRTSY